MNTEEQDMPQSLIFSSSPQEDKKEADPDNNISDKEASKEISNVGLDEFLSDEEPLNQETLEDSLEALKSSDNFTTVDADNPIEREQSVSKKTVKKYKKSNSDNDEILDIEELPKFELSSSLFQELISYTKELKKILDQIEQLKRGAAGKTDWEELAIFIATQKPRVSHMVANAKSIFDKVYGDRLEEIYNHELLRNNGKNPPMERIKILAQRDVASVKMISNRLIMTSQDLQDLLWNVKMVVENSTADEMLPHFTGEDVDLYTDIAEDFLDLQD